MKLSHLSLAIFAAISLAACGGSNNNQVTPEPAPAPAPAPNPDAGNVDTNEIIDPTRTGVVGNLDTKVEASVGTTQYIRGVKSKFDLTNNNDKKTAATSILGVTLNKQNPWLSNLAAARLKTKDGKIALVQYFGNSSADPATITNQVSLQMQNSVNVDLKHASLTKKGNQPTQAVDLDKVKEQITNVKSVIAGYEHDLTTLTAQQQVNLVKMKTLKEDLESLKKVLENDSDYSVGVLFFDENTDSYNWGDDKATDANALNVNDNNAGTGPEALGLVGVNFVGEGSGNTDKVAVQGTEEKSKSSTRIFGRNFDENGQFVEQNSYSGAQAALINKGLTDVDQAAGVTKGDADTALQNKKTELAYGLAVKPAKLDNVQYGRVTGNLDPVKLSDADYTVANRAYNRQEFLTKGDDAAVDTYFYRGVNHTTVAEMQALPKGKKLTYQGHALMYGVDNSFQGIVSDAVPSAFGSGDSFAVGNFVAAEVDLDAALVKGSVYNVWLDKTNHKDSRDGIVNFEGYVHGNTVIGEALRVQDRTDEQKEKNRADFRASFFGHNAEEMGGSFNSTVWQNQYGAKGDVWGGVFGAKVTTTAEEEALTNEWLGDIPGVIKK